MVVGGVGITVGRDNIGFLRITLRKLNRSKNVRNRWVLLEFVPLLVIKKKSKKLVSGLPQRSASPGPYHCEEEGGGEDN